MPLSLQDSATDGDELRPSSPTLALDDGEATGASGTSKKTRNRRQGFGDKSIKDQIKQLVGGQGDAIANVSDSEDDDESIDLTLSGETGCAAARAVYSLPVSRTTLLLHSAGLPTAALLFHVIVTCQSQFCYLCAGLVILLEIL